MELEILRTIDRLCEMTSNEDSYLFGVLSYPTVGMYRKAIKQIGESTR